MSHAVRLLVPSTAALLLALAAMAILLAVLAFQYLGACRPARCASGSAGPMSASLLLGLLGWRWQPRALLGIARSCC